MAKTTMPPKTRQRLLALIHIAKKQLCLREEDYRTLLGSVTGKTSAGEMTLSELNAVIQTFEGMGFKVRGEGRVKGEGVKGKGKLSPRTRDKAVKTPADKVRALWIQCYQAGVVRSRWDEAINQFCKTACGVDRVEWLSHDQARRVIKILEDKLEGASGE